MKRKTTVRKHPRRGTRGVKQHSRDVDSSNANRVPHDIISSDELNPDEEESEEEEEEKPEKDKQDGILDIF